MQKSPCLTYSCSFYFLPVSLLKFSLPSALCSTTHLPKEFASVFQRDVWLPYMHRNCTCSAESEDTHICVWDWICCAFSGCTMKASEAMEERGSTKSSSSGEQGRNLTPLSSGWVANTAAQDGWPHHKAGNGLSAGPHTVTFPYETCISASHSQYQTSVQWRPGAQNHWTMNSGYLRSALTAASLALGDAGVRHNTYWGGWQREVCTARLKAEVQFEVTSSVFPRASCRMTSAISLPKHRHMFS